MEITKKQVNNTFYDHLDEMWSGSNDHPIGLLKAENTVRTPWIQKILKEKTSRNCKVLDIGCGGGLLCNPLAQDGHIVTGIDLSERSLLFAQKSDQTSSVHYLKANATELPFDKETFDVVCAMDLLEHVDEPYKVIQQASRVLKNGGLFFFHTFNKTWLSYLMVIKAVEWFVKNTPKDMHLYSHFIPPQDLKAWCLQNNLQIECIQGLIPDISKKAFWKTAITKKIDDDFTFTFSKSLKTGYVGYAQKIIS